MSTASGSALTTDDRLEIEALYVRYGRAIDEGRSEEFAACFARDGSLHRGSGQQVSGHEALTAFASGFSERAARDSLQYRHVVSSVIFEADAEGVAGSSYSLLIATPAGGPPRLEMSAVYSDRLVREDERWCFATRRVSLDGAAG
jgi:uncharacterized protein (TIGR02246 family)